MKKYDPTSPLISIHIPKCAGSSFSKTLKSWFGRGFYRHYPNGRKNTPPKKHNIYTGIFKKRFKKRICIHGHFNHQRGNGVNDYYPEVEQYITILRDPFEHHLSTYFYVKREGKRNRALREGKVHHIIRNRWSLEDYLRESPKSYICDFLPPEMNINNYKEILDEKFLFIGITERLQDSINSLAEVLGFKPVKVKEINRSERDEEIPAYARERFIENNPIEMAIYQYVLENHGWEHINQESGLSAKG